VSSVGGSATVLDGLSAPSGPSLLYSATDAVAHLLAGGFGLQQTIDTDSYVLEHGLPSSPDSIDFENNHLVGDAAFFTEIDFSDFVNFDNNGGVASDATAGNNGHLVAADLVFGPQLQDSETQIPSENHNLQPPSGASSSGCDVGGIAVGV
jgi:transcriptional activator HAC1